MLTVMWYGVDNYPSTIVCSARKELFALNTAQVTPHGGLTILCHALLGSCHPAIQQSPAQQEQA